MTLNNPGQRGEADRLDEILRKDQPGSRQERSGQDESSLTALVAAARQVEALRPAVAPLPAGGIALARQIFLAQAARMRLQTVRSSHLTPVTGVKRLAGWLAGLGSWFRRTEAWLRPQKGRRAFASGMVAQLTTMTAVVLLFLLLSLTTGTAIDSLGMAAQVSLPGDRYYVYKIAQEDMGVALTFNPAGRVALYVELVKQRSEEIFQLVQAGRPAPIETAARLQQHLEAAILAASQLPDLQMASALLQIRQVSLSTQVTLEQAQGMAHDDPSNITLNIAASAASNASALAKQGLADPHEFRLLMSALPPLPSATPSSAVAIIHPPFYPTPVSVMPTATNILFNPPAASPTPYVLIQPSGTPVVVMPTATSILVNPPAASPTPYVLILPSGTPVVVMPTATSILINPPVTSPTPSATNVPASPTPIPTPTATQTPEPPSPPTPTPISQQGEGN